MTKTQLEKSITQRTTLESPYCSTIHVLLLGYVRGAAALVIIGVIFDFFGTFLTGLGLRSTDPNKKYKYYRVAIYALILACEQKF